MTETAKDLLRKALTLNTEDRASLAGALIESLDDHVDADVTGAWDEEIERRVAQLESQAVGTVPWSAVRERLFHGFIDVRWHPDAVIDAEAAETGTRREVLSLPAGSCERLKQLSILSPKPRESSR